MARSICNLSSDEADEQQTSSSAISMAIRRGRRRLAPSLEHYRDRLRHANPFATPAARWMTFAMILCWSFGFFCRQWRIRYEHISELCHVLRQERKLHRLSRGNCIRMGLWLVSSQLDICGFGITFALGLISRRLRNHGVTTVKIAASYLAALNVFWLLTEAWAYRTNAQDPSCYD